uniref:Uncharacterized protein n=1 Tax=Arundo donax TaxID=35708 RepID=A0A0A9A1B7_ARUDO
MAPSRRRKVPLRQLH